MSAHPSPLRDILKQQGLEVPQALPSRGQHAERSDDGLSLGEALIQHGLALTYGVTVDPVDPVEEGDPQGPGAPGALLNAYRRSASARVLGLQSLLTRLSEGFEDAGIPYLVLKGPIVAEELYGGPSARDYIDLDVYVAQEDKEAAERIVEESGARRVRSEDRWQEPPWHTSWQDGSERKLELHTDLTRPSVPWPPSFEDLYERRRQVAVDGTRYPTLGAEDTFLYLLLHGLRHRWSRLVWVDDVARLADEYDPSTLEAALQAADEAGVGSRAAFSAEHLRSFGISIPQASSARIGDERFEHLSSYCLRMLAQAQVEESPWERLQVDYSLADGKAAFLGRKVRGVLHHVVRGRFLSGTSSPGTRRHP